MTEAPGADDAGGFQADSTATTKITDRKGQHRMTITSTAEGTRFTLAAPGALRAQAASRPASRLAPLGKIWKGYTASGFYEVVKAVTADGEWLFELDGNNWAAGHLPTRTVVRTGLRSLTACRRYAASGDAVRDLANDAPAVRA